MIELTEKFLLPEMRSGLTTLFRVNSFEKIAQQDSLTLPDSVYQFTSKAITATIKGLREQEADFGFKSGKFVLLSEHTGTQLDLNTTTAQSTDLDEGSFLDFCRALYDHYIGPPVLIAFHTHFPITVEHFAHKNVVNITMTRDSEIVRVPLHLGVPVLDAVTEFPSPTDIGNLVKNCREWRSMLIAGKWGYKFIVNPNLKLPLISSPIGLEEYKNDHFDAQFDSLKASSVSQKPETQLVRNTMNAALSSYCTKNNLLLFSNSNPKSNVLKRIV